MRFMNFIRRLPVLVLALLLMLTVAPFGVAAESQPRVWMFDPGHGGSDPGAVNGPRYEKDDNLRLALAVAERMRASGETVVLTRETDVSVELNARSDMANEQGVTYFVSFHRNSATQVATGAETYYHNALDETSESAKLAAVVQRALVDVGFKDRGVKQANFSVLRRTDMPAILLETGFINNAADSLCFDDNFEELADRIAAALLSHVGKELVKEAPPAAEPEPDGEENPGGCRSTVGVGLPALAVCMGGLPLFIKRRKKHDF